MYLQVMKKCLKKSFVLSFFVFVSSLSFPGDALSQSGCDGKCRRELAQVRRATAKYHRVEVALADGYAPDLNCVALPNGSAAMGIHYSCQSKSRNF